MMLFPGDYVKYTYWVTPDERQRLAVSLEERGERVKPARSVMCTPLDPFHRVGYISPPVWDRVCHRQGSWYRRSSHYGRELLVLSFPLEGFTSRLNTMISLSDFRPPRFASRQERERLVRSKAYLTKRPGEWELVTPEEKRRWERWMTKEHIHEPLEDLILTHSANHANFMDPVFSIRQNGHDVPYSIAPSTHLCSCCAELYNLIGKDFPRKLVAPCLGALNFAGLPRDRYFEVISSTQEAIHT